MSKALPPLSSSQNHNNSYTAGTSAAYGGGEATGRSYNSSTARTVGPARLTPKLPQIDFTLGPLQERTLPPYNDLEDPHLYPYWRRQEMLTYERQARREEQARRERQDARQREASRRRFNERRRRELEELAAKKGARSTSANEKAGGASGHRASRKSKTSQNSRVASQPRRSSNQYPTEADQYDNAAAAREPSTTDSDDDELAYREEDALWDYVESFMDPHPAGVPLRDLPLMSHTSFVDLAKEHQKLSALDAKPTSRLDDIEYEMDVYAEKLAEAQKWADREAFLGTAVNGIALRDLPLDDNAEFVELERTRRDLHAQSSPSRRQRIATVEARMQEICSECALAKQQSNAVYPTEEDHRHSTTSESESEAASDEEYSDDADSAATPLHATETDVWSDREEYLGAYPEGVALRDIPLDSNETFTALEAERRHLLRDGHRGEHEAALSKIEDRLRALCGECARAVKADQEAAAAAADAKNRYEDDAFESAEDDGKWNELGSATHETSASNDQRSASSKRDSVNPDDGKWAELGDDAKEKSASASVKPLVASEIVYPVEKDTYDDEAFEDSDNDSTDKDEDASAHATREVDAWAELGDDAKDEAAATADVAPTGRLFAAEEEEGKESNAYSDDDFEEEAKSSAVASSKRSSVNPDDSKWDEIGDDDAPKDAESVDNTKSSSAVSSKRSSVASSAPLSSHHTSESGVKDAEATHDKWAELGDDDDDDVGRRSESAVVEDEALVKSSGASTPVSTSPDKAAENDYDDDDDWDEL